MAPSKRILIAIAVCLWLTGAQAGDWFWIDGKVNGKPVRLVLDTGCSPGLVLFRDTTQRLGLKLREVQKQSTNQIPFWITEEKDLGVLALDLPNAEGGGKGVLIVDTGAGGTGVELSPRRWQEWRGVHTNRSTLTGIYNPHDGVYAREQGWADRLSLGPLELTDVLIEKEEADHFFPRTVPDYAATFGLEALKRLDLIVDGKHGIAYLRPKETPSAPVEHNRLGAVFVPRAHQEAAKAHSLGVGRAS